MKYSEMRPYYIQLICYYAIKYNNEIKRGNEKITEEIIDKVYDDVILDSNFGTIAGMWKEFGADVQNIIINAINNNKLPDDVSSELIEKLSSKHLIDKKTKQLTIANCLLEWIKKNEM